MGWDSGIGEARSITIDLVTIIQEGFRAELLLLQRHHVFKVLK